MVDHAAFNPRGKVATCHCGAQLCFECKGDWHPGRTCEAAADLAVQAWAKAKDTGRCPRCRAFIERRCNAYRSYSALLRILN